MPSKRTQFLPVGQDIAGLRFGRMVVVSRSSVLAKSGYLWNCRCDCGKEFLANAGSVRRGDYQSCGCYRADKMVKHDMVKTPEYRAWADMLDRCRNPKNPRYKDYGGRGITVAPLWEYSFSVFYADMGPRPDRYQLDRIDNNGNYGPGNCRWTTAKKNARNRRTARILEFNGKSMSLVEWAEQLGVRPGLIRSRLTLGWPIEAALMLPSGKKNRRLKLSRPVSKKEDR